MKRLIAWLVLHDGDRIVRIKSLRPDLYRNHYGKWELSWPCLLIDLRCGSRLTIWPIWNRARVLGLFGLHRPPPPPPPQVSTASFDGPAGNR